MIRKTVSSLLKKYKIRPNKNLGQNFLLETHLMDKMTDALDFYPDEDVLEIGSGLGVLSAKMARQALSVVGIEKDKKLFEIAKKEFEEQKNLKFIHGNFLDLNLPNFSKNYHLPMKVLGNIPYNLSSRILFKLLDSHFLFSTAVLTLQKEVAARLVGPVGTKDYGILTILFGIQTECKKIFDIEPGSFLPPPQVTSSVIKITFLKQPPHIIHNLELFKKIVRTAFQQRRKTIRNTLKKLLKNGRLNPWGPCKIDPNLRPEQITIPQYVTLANCLNTLL